MCSYVSPPPTSDPHPLIPVLRSHKTGIQPTKCNASWLRMIHLFTQFKNGLSASRYRYSVCLKRMNFSPADPCELRLSIVVVSLSLLMEHIYIRWICVVFTTWVGIGCRMAITSSVEPNLHAFNPH